MTDQHDIIIDMKTEKKPIPYKLIAEIVKYKAKEIKN